ncbi:MAG: hypothetical protein LQ352_005672 [Teloschistes flavicans]|nr:MAG: hypothetical protein LQ352_005672 [Teloschistes flavicans]
MDVLTKWFQFSLGVEPNKATLQNLASGVNDYTLAQYASTASPEQFLSSTPLSPTEKQKLIEQYVSSPAGKQELDKTLRKQEKAQRQPIIWQIPEEKMNELKWQRTQLLRLQAAQRAKANPAAAKKAVVPKVTQGGAKRVGPQKQIPKLGSSKASSVAGGSVGTPKKPLAAAPQKKTLPNGNATKTPAGKPPVVAKAAPKTNGIAKPIGK